jgi:nickel/cobalt exporter
VDNFNQLIRQGSLHAWFYIPTGHSKTMMAAFIIAIRGTVLQAVMLGLCAAFSHSLVIWLLAGLALHYGGQWNAEGTEPYFQLGSAAVIMVLALWMAWRTHRDVKAEADHDHEHAHAHHHHERGYSHPSEEEAVGYQDAHELAHATDIQKRFANRTVTNGQIALFGLTGGLLPCPAAFTIVLVCLQLEKIALGIAMVLAFSAGLALTLVATGALAAWSLHHAQKRFSGLGSIARKLPYLSSAILTLMAFYIGLQGWLHLTHA